MTNLSQIDCVEPNEDMFNFGKERFKNEKNVKWFNQYAESLPFEEIPMIFIQSVLVLEM